MITETFEMHVCNFIQPVVAILSILKIEFIRRGFKNVLKKRVFDNNRGRRCYKLHLFSLQRFRNNNQQVSYSIALHCVIYLLKRTYMA